MNTLSKEKLDRIIDFTIDKQNCILVHEAALMVWNLDNNFTPYGVDFLVPESLFESIRIQHNKQIQEYLGNEYLEFDSSYVIRVWKSVGEEIFFDENNLVECLNAVGYRALDPKLVLEALPSSPDFKWLYEQRAGLAEVLYFDDMTDEQLMEFRSFVRTV